MPEEIKQEVKTDLSQIEIEKPAASLLDEAKQSAKELRELIAQQKEVVHQLENLRASEILKGKAEAGVTAQPVVETPQEYAKRIMRGGK